MAGLQPHLTSHLLLPRLKPTMTFLVAVVEVSLQTINPTESSTRHVQRLFVATTRNRSIH
jgi:hypothetical protein